LPASRGDVYGVGGRRLAPRVDRNADQLCPTAGVRRRLIANLNTTKPATSPIARTPNAARVAELP
jgi:hypothetical protein